MSPPFDHTTRDQKGTAHSYSPNQDDSQKDRKLSRSIIAHVKAFSRHHHGWHDKPGQHNRHELRDHEYDGQHKHGDRSKNDSEPNDHDNTQRKSETKDKRGDNCYRGKSHPGHQTPEARTEDGGHAKGSPPPKSEVHDKIDLDTTDDRVDPSIVRQAHMYFRYGSCSGYGGYIEGSRGYDRGFGAYHTSPYSENGGRLSRNSHTSSGGSTSVSSRTRYTSSREDHDMNIRNMPASKKWGDDEDPYDYRYSGYRSSNYYPGW